MGVHRADGTTTEAATLNIVAEDERLRRSITRQVGFVILGVVLLAVIFLSATAQAVSLIDRFSITDDQDRAALALSRTISRDPVALRAIEEAYQLRGLRLVEPGEVKPEEVSLPAGAGEDQVIAWTPRRIGSEIFAQVAPIRITSALMLLAAIAFILFRLHRLARHLDRQRAAARRLARRDPLTGLANRLEFNEEFARHFEAGAENAALILLDLDGFKAVNDRHGHLVGDALLKDVAGRLATHVREGDLVARLGGDEFAIICRGALTDHELECFAGALVPLLAAPIMVDGGLVAVTVSLGVARIPGDAGDAETAIRLADAALYRAKAARGGKLEHASSTARAAA